MSTAEPQNRKPVIRVSHLREFVYCPRAWAYSSRNIPCKLSQEEIAAVERRLEAGREHHRRHGEAVILASRKRRHAANWQYIGFAAAGLAVALLLAWGR